MRARAVIPNDDRVFSPGFLTRVKLPFGQPQPALLVTERAIGTDQGRKDVMVGNDKGVVEYRQGKLGPAVEGLRAITSGLAPGEWVVVNGIQRARPGATVTPERVAMEPKPAVAPARSDGAGGAAPPANS